MPKIDFVTKENKFISASRFQKNCLRDCVFFPWSTPSSVSNLLGHRSTMPKIDFVTKENKFIPASRFQKTVCMI